MTGLLTFTPRGIYCAAGDFYIDPWRPVERALITHGHADHARAGHKNYLSTHSAAPVIRHRLGGIALEEIAYSEPRQIGGAKVSFHPAGHVLGSAQIRVEVGGEVWVASGDYKTEADGVCEPFEPVKAHAFITECTFGLPIYSWAPQDQVAKELNAWWAACIARGKTPILGAYSLGKAQRLLAMLDTTQGPILTHGAVEATNAILRGQGLRLPNTIQVTPELNPKDHPGAIVLAPPAALDAAWTKRFGATETGFASGWMRLRGVRRNRSATRGFVISDHADWQGLNQAIRETGAERVFVTHGYTAQFQRYLAEQGYDAAIVETEFQGDSMDSAPE